MSAASRERMLALLFVAPATLIIGAFVVYPTFLMLVTSFRQPTFIDPEGGPFIGLENYRAALSSDLFRQSVRNTIVFTLLVVPAQTIAALLLAVWAQGPGVSRRVLRVSVFLPTTISLAVLSVLWSLLYAAPELNSPGGLFNGMLASLGLPGQPFLDSPTQALPAIVVMSIWQGVGLQMIVLLAALQQIPEQLYEAAQLDGASSRARFFHVTLPGVAPTLAFVIMMTTIFALKLFAQPFIMTRGGPEGATQAVVQFIYEAAFVDRDIGIACAAAVLFFTAVLVVTLGLRSGTRFTERLA